MNQSSQGEAFTSTPDFRPFDVLPPEVSLWAKNQSTAPMAAWSAKANFSQPDLASPRRENQAIWKSVRGRHSRMSLRPG
jgi:hypothetical protein